MLLKEDESLDCELMILEDKFLTKDLVLNVLFRKIFLFLVIDVIRKRNLLKEKVFNSRISLEFG